MKKIDLKGIDYIEELKGTSKWFYGMDYINGDLYEAEELFKNNYPIKRNRLVFVKYPEGLLVEPIQAKEGQYFGRPIYSDGKICILLVDFKENQIIIYQYEAKDSKLEKIASLSLSNVEDCYNLLLDESPLMLTRSPNDGIFQIIYPEALEIEIENGETFFEREGDKLYFNRWREGENGQEINEVIVRKYPSGQVIEVLPGNLIKMPDGQNWLIG